MLVDCRLTVETAGPSSRDGGTSAVVVAGPEAAEPGGHWGHVPPHFSPQSMKCPTSTGPYMLGLQCIRKECPEGQ